ncbi:MAG: MMPL family transporter [Deltaproteobacteria bacterium]|nr:MMPL family transporter [Deltaproteobacteria bacterium]
MKEWLERYARWCARNSWSVVAATGIACVVGFLLARNLSISSDLAALLPEGATSVSHIELAARRVGSTDALHITIQSPDKLVNRRFVDAAVAVVQRWPEHPLILSKLDIRYFKNRRLLYADLSDLEQVRDNLATRIHWEKVHSNPAYVDLEGKPAPEILPPGLEEKYEDRYREELGLTLSRGADAELVGPGGSDESRLEDIDYLYLEKAVQVRGPGGVERTEYITTVMLRFRTAAVDIDTAENAVYRAECMIGTRTGADCHDLRRWPGAERLPPEASVVLHAKDFHPEARAEIGGGLRSRVIETDALYKDVRASAIGSLVAMSIIIFVSFRRLRALLYVMVPLLVGILMCLAVAWLLVGKLNVISAFCFAILVGLGIDFGIHLGKRYEEERLGGLGNEDAIARAFGSTGRAMALAMITTVLAFATLLASRFRGFSQFGELCAIGIPLSMFAAYILFPAVVTIADRVRPVRPKPGRASLPPEIRRFASRPVGWIVVTALAVTTVVALLASQSLRFEYNFAKLRTKRPVIGHIDQDLATRGFAGSPAVGMADSPELAGVAYRQLQRRTKGERSPLRAVFSIFSFVPEQQARKLSVLNQIDLLMNDPSFGFYEDRLSDEDLDRLDEWRAYLLVGAVDPLAAGFPQWGKDLFAELPWIEPTPEDATADERTAIADRNAARTAPVGRILYLMPRRSLNDGLEAMRLQQEFQTVRLPGGKTVPVAASGFVFADVVRSIRRDGAFVSGIALVFVFAVLFAGYRSLARATIVLLPLIVGLAWLFGILVLFDIPLTFFSIVMIPVVIGTGIDASIHLHQRYRELGPGSIPTVLRRTGPPVILSTVTTMAGFGSLMLTKHGGLASMGQLAAIGMSTVLVATLIGLPALILATERRKHPTSSDPGPPDGRERRRA